MVATEVRLRLNEAGVLVLPDGTEIAYRPIRPEDAPALQRFHTRLSERSIFNRFFEYMPRLSDRQAAYFAAADGDDRVALVALDPGVPGELIGVVRIDRDPGTEQAEYAAIVADGWQGRGVGYGLTGAIVTAARARGIRQLYALVLPNNAQMLRLLRNFGLPERHTWVDGVERVELTLIPPVEPAG
jgi:RimJ/RimL family protein N-acetyltransferase